MRYGNPRRWSSYVAEALVVLVLAAYVGRLAWSLLSPMVPYAVSGLILLFTVRWLFSRF